MEMLKKLFVYILGIYNGLFGSKTACCCHFSKKQNSNEDKDKQSSLEKKTEKYMAAVKELSSSMDELGIKYQQRSTEWNINSKKIESDKRDTGDVTKYDYTTNVAEQCNEVKKTQLDKKFILCNLFFCLVGLIAGYLINKYFA